MIRSLLIITAFLLSLFSSQVPAAAVASLKNFVDKVQTFRAGFSQTLLDQNFRVLQKSGGSMLFARPGKFRWSYDTPYQQLIVGDGEQVWFYDQDLEQVTARKLDITLGSTPAALLAGGKQLNRILICRKSRRKGNLNGWKPVPKAKTRHSS